MNEEKKKIEEIVALLTDERLLAVKAYLLGVLSVLNATVAK